MPSNRVIPGLANNGTYTVGVRATNVVDGQSYPGPFTDANPVAPFGKPFQAITDGFHHGNSQVRITVAPPAANGRPVAGFEWSSRYPDDGRTGPSGVLPAGGGEIFAGDKPDQNVEVLITTVDSEGNRSDVLRAGGRTYQNISFTVNGEFGGLCAWTSYGQRSRQPGELPRGRRRMDGQRPGRPVNCAVGPTVSTRSGALRRTSGP